MTSTLAPQAPALDRTKWEEWRRERLDFISQPDGPSALITAHWVPADDAAGAEHYSGLPGRWYRTDDTVVGTGIPQTFTPTGTIQLRAGESVSDGNLTVRAFEQQGEFAVKAFNRHAPKRISFHSIATFEPREQWVLTARLKPDADTVNLTAADGTIIPTPTIGWVEFEFENMTHRLRIVGSGGKLWTIFSDASTAAGVYPFRFIDFDRPDARGNITIDFNRAYLPPLAFSDHFLCPTPTPTNNLPFAVEAGEKWPIFD